MHISRAFVWRCIFGWSLFFWAALVGVIIYLVR